MASDDIVRSLRAALESSPNNVDLRRHLADALVALGQNDEAGDVLREALRLAPGDVETKLALARSYRVAGKYSAAQVILEQMIQDDEAIARARVERSKTLFAEGNTPDAVREYRRAVDEDPDVGDPEYGEKLGVTGAEDSPEFEGGPVEGRLPWAGAEEDLGPALTPIRSDLDFSKVGGMTEVKRSIQRKIIDPMLHPETFAAFGKKAGGGILLYGPPGCGKTHLARATAGEIDSTFLAIGIHDVLDMWIGRSERNLNQVFETARANRPCVLFFDEADALGASRSELRGSAGRQTINQFLAELDGVQADNDGVLVLAATNAPWQMDSAFRRPGRFDRVIFVPPPDLDARAAILEIQLTGKPQDAIDRKAIAKKTDGFSGADLQAVVDTAIEEKIEVSVASGSVAPLTTKDLLKAVKARKPTTKEWFQTARNYVRYANENGLYDELKPYVGL